MRAWTAAGLLLVGLALGWMAATLLRSEPGPAARQVARAPGLSPGMRANADWMVALFAKGAGDLDRARRELESIVSRYRDHPEEHMRSFATMAESALASLE